MNTLAVANSGLISISTEFRDMFGIDEQDLTGPGALRFLAERIGRDLVVHRHFADRRRIDEWEAWITRAAVAVRMLIMRPFCRLHDIAEACCCETDEAIRLLAAIYRHRETAAFLTRFSADAPYRKSTIQPLIESGAVKAFLDGTFHYPFTVGVYPAVSCMLSCSFCARAQGAQYKQEDIFPGNELLRQLFAEAPQDSPRRFYLSGGLEPLTNPGLAELVRFAASLGHRMQLYTNAMMLTQASSKRTRGCGISIRCASPCMERTTRRPS